MFRNNEVKIKLKLKYFSVFYFQAYERKEIKGIA